MRVVLDTNILVSAWLFETGHLAAIYRAWQDGAFELLTCTEQLTELPATLRKPVLAACVKPHPAVRLVNQHCRRHSQHGSSSDRRLPETVRSLVQVSEQKALTA